MFRRYPKNKKPKNYRFGNPQLCIDIQHLMWVDNSQLSLVNVEAKYFAAELKHSVELIDKWNAIFKQEMGCYVNGMSLFKRTLNQFLHRINASASQNAKYQFDSDRQLVNAAFSTVSDTKLFKVHRIINIIARVSNKYLSQSNRNKYFDSIVIIIKKQFFHEIFKYAMKTQKVTYVILPWEQKQNLISDATSNASPANAKVQKKTTQPRKIKRQSTELQIIHEDGLSFHCIYKGDQFYVDGDCCAYPPGFLKKYPEYLLDNHQQQLLQLQKQENKSKNTSIVSSNSDSQTPNNESISMFEKVVKTYCHYNDINVNAISQSDLNKICALTDQYDNFNDIMTLLM